MIVLRREHNYLLRLQSDFSWREGRIKLCVCARIIIKWKLKQQIADHDIDVFRTQREKQKQKRAVDREKEKKKKMKEKEK